MHLFVYIHVIITFSVLDRVQSFLPQMAHANDELRRKMVTAPAHQFDIENLDSATEKVIEMVNAYYIFLFYKVNLDVNKIIL